ncbi:hypothetical protein Pelo_5831 [Pelomyxa schiedti]|nr:hypothetical protein Pelo_5831 [Pelomyxa schiedti]
MMRARVALQHGERGKGLGFPMCANGKWFMFYAKKDSVEVGLFSPLDRSSQVVTLSVPDSWKISFACCNPIMECEALTVVSNGEGLASLWSVDLAESFRTKAFCIVNTVNLHSIPPPSNIFCVLAMRKRNGKPIFIITFSGLSSNSWDAVYSVEPSDFLTPAVTKVKSTRDVWLRQVSTSKFCIVGKSQAYLWDCDNLKKPIMCIQLNRMQDFMAGLGFFLRVSEDKRTIHVIEASAEMKCVATVEFLLPDCSFCGFVPNSSLIS